PLTEARKRSSGWEGLPLSSAGVFIPPAPVEGEAMQRCCGRLLRPLAAAAAGGGGGRGNASLSSASRRFLSHSSLSSQIRQSPLFPFHRSSPFKYLSPPAHGQPAGLGFRYPLVSPFQMMQKRDYAAKERSRAPATPVTSKLKKYKIKGYSSFKSRFRTMNDGNIRRWRAGKRHNAHLKSKKSKRRLRKPEIVSLAYAKVMKKLHFCS
ncbi:hypothetical protein Taro_008052, partial [Colocasia esculenta]|nr:hypothetical protein [Colocasia esculenta]